MKQITLISFIILNSISISIYAQQNYSELSSLGCRNTDETGPSPAFLYTCNGQHKFCQAFLIFKSQPPYNSIPTISNLMSVHPQELARVNNISSFAEFSTGKEVIVPVNCSCSGQSYQANTTFIQTNLTYYLIPTQVFQGLSTCSSIMQANSYDEFHLNPGLELKVPLTCACPTKNQIDTGTKYLLTYHLTDTESIADIVKRFKVDTKNLLFANGLTKQVPILSASTTILIPFSTQPSSSITLSHQKNNTNQGLVPFRQKRPKSRGKKFAVYAIVAGCALLVLFVVISIVMLICKKRKKGLFKMDERARSIRVSPEKLRVEIANHVEKVLQVFGLEEIKKATESFSPKNRIKGSVYYGVFGRDTTKAVKKISSDSSKAVSILKKINHFNLIKLEGFCKYHNHLYLVFEYMENGSLKEWLSCDTSKMISSWNTRIQIALDIAQGLDYLHSFTKPIYVHKNIKSSNVLLNGENRAKIANFSHAGEATSQTSSTNANTFPRKHVMGTRGYLAPEYLATGIATSMIDVYAFGVVILELITGKKAVTTKDGNRVVLSAAIVSIMEGDSAEAEFGLFIDSRLEGDCLGLAMGLVEISVSCLNPDPENRPTMGEIVSALLKIQTDYQRINLSDKAILH